MQNETSNNSYFENQFKYVDSYLNDLKESALHELIEILGDEELLGELSAQQINDIDDYHSVKINNKEYFKFGSGKPPAGILRISKKFERKYQEEILAKLVDAKESLEFAKGLAEQESN